MTCPTCAIPLTGCIDVKCANCCARLIISARPNRKAQEGMFEVIRRTPNGAKFDDVIAAIKFNERG